jgi:hypothetical protein
MPDPEQFELESRDLAEEDLDEPRSFRADNAELVATDDLSPADMEAEDHAEQELDYRLEQTFPASDPVSINPGSD